MSRSRWTLTALLGPSGSGKSTLLRCIAGLETPDSGAILVSGADVGFVFQHYAAFKHMTLARYITFGLEVRKRPKEAIERRVEELLELVRHDGTELAVQLTRDEAGQLELEPRQIVYVTTSMARVFA